MICDACKGELRPSEATLAMGTGDTLAVHTHNRSCREWLSHRIRPREQAAPTPPSGREKPARKPTRAERLAANANRPRGRVRFDDLYGTGE